MILHVKTMNSAIGIKITKRTPKFGFPINLGYKIPLYLTRLIHGWGVLSLRPPIHPDMRSIRHIFVSVNIYELWTSFYAYRLNIYNFWIWKPDFSCWEGFRSSACIPSTCSLPRAGIWHHNTRYSFHSTRSLWCPKSSIPRWLLHNKVAGIFILLRSLFCQQNFSLDLF